MAVEAHAADAEETMRDPAETIPDLLEAAADNRTTMARIVAAEMAARDATVVRVMKHLAPSSNCSMRPVDTIPLLKQRCNAIDRMRIILSMISL